MSTLDLTTTYTLTNAFTQSTKQLASNDDSISMDSPSTSSDNHLWYLTTTDLTSYYRLHTKATGDSKSLDVVNTNDANSTTLHFASTGRYSGQYWRFDTWGDGTYRLSNNFTGVDMHLDTYSDTLEPFLGSRDHTGQHWSFGKAGSVAATASLVSSAVPTVSASQTTSTSTAPATTPVGGHGLPIGAIVGIAIGGLIILTLCICGIVFCMRSKRVRGGSNTADQSGLSPPAYTATEGEKSMVATVHGTVYAHQYPAELMGGAVQNPVEMPSQRL